MKSVRISTWRWLLVAAALALPLASASGQVTDGTRIYDEELRVNLDEQMPLAQEMGFDAGGWFNFAFFDYDDASARKQRTLGRYALRTWASMNVQGVHRAYFRGLLQYDDWHGSDNPTNARGDDFTETVERAWYEFDLGQLMANQSSGRRPPVGLRVRVGRQFTTIGSALVLSMPLDAVRFYVTTHDWDVTTFLGQAIRHTPNIDSSDRVAHRQERCFVGVEATYKGLGQHRPYAFFLNNQDNTGSHPRDAAQSYEYTSRYVGVGSSGPLIGADLLYRAEVVGEWGRTYSNGVAAGRDDICALAIDAQIIYAPKVQTTPKITFEYLFGSGDGDRLGSTTSTIGGNRAGTRDTAFNAFGFRDTGIALSPRVSNIHIYSVGGSFFPFETVALLAKMEIGTRLFFYQKAKSAGAISDPAATNDAPWLGFEWDVFCNWRITSDLAYTLRYGAFMPGSAYDGGDRTCRQFLYTGLVFSF